LRELLDWARARQAEMTRLLAEIVDIESPSDHPAGVRALATRLGEPLADLGLDVEQLPVPAAGPILRARTPGASRAVMLLGHLDTVWPVGTVAQRPAHVEGDRLRGPGAYDMKGGLVVALFALRALHARGRRVPVTVFFTPLEEVDCGPYREVMESEMKASAAVLDFEPAWPGGAVKTERKGSGSYVLTAHGIASHAGADLSRGANAILELARQCLEVSTFTDAARGVSVNVGVIRGGLRPNVVPDLASAEIDVRFRTWADGQALERSFRRLPPSDPRLRLTLEGGLHYPPLERTPQVARVYATAREVAWEMGLELAEVSTGGASEVSFAGALGLPALDGLGPDGDGAHSLDEHVLLSSLPTRVALTAGLLWRLTAGDRD
jgi:glutamate carboxypeptidase